MFGDFTALIYTPGEVVECVEEDNKKDKVSQEFINLCHETYRTMEDFVKRLAELMSFNLTESEISEVEISTMQVVKNYRSKIDGLDTYIDNMMVDMNKHSKLYNKMLVIKLTLEADWIAKTAAELKRSQSSIIASSKSKRMVQTLSSPAGKRLQSDINSSNTPAEWCLKNNTSGLTSQLFMTMEKMDSLSQALKATKEIAQMGEMIAFEIERQSEMINHIYDLAKETEEDIQTGNVHLASAIKRVKKSTKIMLCIIAVCTLSVLISGIR